MLKLKMMLCVMMLPLVVVGCTSSSLSVSATTTASGVDNAASPRLADTAERDYFTLRERLITMPKQLEGTQKYINGQLQIELPISMGSLMQLLASNTHALPAEYKCLK